MYSVKYFSNFDNCKSIFEFESLPLFTKPQNDLIFILRGLLSQSILKPPFLLDQNLKYLLFYLHFHCCIY